MKILNRLTIKHLLMNKKRTIVTIIGITLSTALMVGIGLLISSFLQMMIDDEVKTSGSYHANFNEITNNELEQVKRNVMVENSYYYGILGFSNIDSTNSYKPYLYVLDANDDYFLHEKLLEGRYPLNEYEIVIPKHLITNGELNLSIGDKITLNIGPRLIEGEKVYSNNISLVKTYDENYNLLTTENIEPEFTKTYEIVGIIDRSNTEDYSAPGYTAFTTKSKNVLNYSLFVEYQNIKKTYELTKGICDKLNKNASCTTHDGLLYYYGVSKYSNVTRTITSLLTIVLTLLSIGSIIVIYNSFAISTMERKKSFGLYSSLGATPKQIKYTVFFEAFLVGIIGILLGVIGSFLGIYILIQVLNYLVSDAWDLTLVFKVNWYYVFIPIIFMILVVYFSAFIPAKRSSKVSSIELIRENDEIKIPRKKVKTPKWIKKIFGIEGEIALKNMKRNKRKYRITLLSIFISIVLFISFSTYINYGLSITDINKLPNYDILVISDKEDIIDEIKENPLVNSVYTSYISFIDTKFLTKDNYPEKYYNYAKLQNEDILQFMAVIVEDQDFEKITKDFNVDNDTVFILNNLTYVEYSNNNRISNTTEIFKNNISNLEICNTFDKSICKNLKVKLINSNETNLFDNYSYEETMPVMFISNKLAKENNLFAREILNENNQKEITDFDNMAKYITIKSTEYEKLYQELSKKYDSNLNGNIYAPKIEYRNQKNSILAIKILMYGFISLVTLTGITSVFNTIYTSIHLRRKEFAMLRSVGLSPKGFYKMIFFESLFFGLKSLLYALPVSFFVIYLISESIGYTFSFNGLLIPWKAIIIAIVGVFVIVLITMLYSVKKIKNENILNSLQDENI